jgi:hypothetical protein
MKAEDRPVMEMAMRPRGRNTSLNEKIYTTFDGAGSLRRLCLELLSEQKKAWQDLREGYASLKEVRERDVPCSGFSVRLQYNPRRIKSSTAVVDGKDAKERKCFLCWDHLPEGQKGILYRADYLILCNPMPVFSPHFTVSHLDHQHQAIDEHIGTFLQLVTDFGDGWTVLYNGPKCGASAPDHLHFQAAPSGQMPIEKEIHEEKRLTLIKQVDDALIYCAMGLGRKVIVLEGDDHFTMERGLENYLSALKRVLLIDEEPMINIAGFYEEMKWRFVIFPRRKHRPDTFFKLGDSQIVISPGVIDMGGLLITPVEKDFERLDGTALENIYKEVSLDRMTMEKAIDAIVRNTDLRPLLSPP